MMFLVFYGLPEVLLGAFDIDINSWNRLNFVVIALSLLFSAPCSEIMRSAYLAVAKVQREAALSIGLTEAQAFRRIVLPQALVSALPNLGNSFILLMKEGALAYTIGIVDIMGKGQLINRAQFRRLFGRDVHRVGGHLLAVDAGNREGIQAGGRQIIGRKTTAACGIGERSETHDH